MRGRGERPPRRGGKNEGDEKPAGDLPGVATAVATAPATTE
jgi:hypothetical protein